MLSLLTDVGVGVPPLIVTLDVCHVLAWQRPSSPVQLGGRPRWNGGHSLGAGC